MEIYEKNKIGTQKSRIGVFCIFYGALLAFHSGTMVLEMKKVQHNKDLI